MAVIVTQGRAVVSPLRIQTKLDDEDNDDDYDAADDDEMLEEYLLTTGSSSGSSSTSAEDAEEEEDFEPLYNGIPNSPSSRSHRLIPATHPLKLAWDILTFLLSLWNAYLTHVAIRDRSFDYSRTRFVTEVWFAIDILLNFITERRVHGRTLTTFQSVSAYYLTTWFVIDVVSLLPGELLFVSPVIQQLQKRTRIQKFIHRIKSIGRWTRKLLRDPHVRHASVLYTRRKGVRAASKMVRLFLFYIPKYFLFIRNMKAVIGFRILRQVRLVRHMFVRRGDNNNVSALSPPPMELQDNILISYEDDDDDGSPY